LVGWGAAGGGEGAWAMPLRDYELLEPWLPRRKWICLAMVGKAWFLDPDAVFVPCLGGRGRL